MSKRVIVSWSSGKDSAWMLHVLNCQPDVKVIGLLTAVNEEFDRVTMHGVRRTLLEAQAQAAELPLFKVSLPWPCSNEIYESTMLKELAHIKDKHGPTHMAFGDLFLDDVRQYRIKQMADTGYNLMFPLWHIDTGKLAKEMIDAGLRALICCVDPKQLNRRFAGRVFDETLLEELPDSVDPCGENGEFHSFAFAGPMFRSSLAVKTGATVERDNFVFTDLKPV